MTGIGDVPRFPAQYIRADCVDLPLPSRSVVQVAVTSTAYLGQACYGDDRKEMGRGSLKKYIAEQLDLAAELRRVMRPSGVYFLNVGEKRSGSGGAGGDYNTGGSKAGLRRYGKTDMGPMRAGQVGLVPFKVAEAISDAGLFYLRSVIIWDKGQSRPEDQSHVKRPLLQWEPIFVFTCGKAGTYPWHYDRVWERGDVWHFPPVRSKRTSLCPFPEELPARCIFLASDPGDLVIDPCCGGGTTMKVAERLGRRSIGFDLYPPGTTVPGAN